MSVKNRAGKLKRHAESCGSKRRYGRRDDAAVALLLMARRSGARANQLQPYRCLACRSWHYGHKM